MLQCNIGLYILYNVDGRMFESSQVECICGKPVTMGNEEEHAAGKIIEVIGEKKIQLFHSIDCALISKRLESK